MNIFLNEKVRVDNYPKIPISVDISPITKFLDPKTNITNTANETPSSVQIPFKNAGPTGLVVETPVVKTPVLVKLSFTKYKLPVVETPVVETPSLVKLSFTKYKPPVVETILFTKFKPVVESLSFCSEIIHENSRVRYPGILEKSRVNTHLYSPVNEDLFFPVARYINDTSQKVSEEKDIFQCELLSPKDCVSYKCPKPGCKTTALFHPDIIAAGAAGCITCDGIEKIITNILNLRGYKFIRTFRNTSNKIRVEFSCNTDHINSVSYEDLRKGRPCQVCSREKRKKPILEMAERVPCNCFELRLGWGTKTNYICAHYNFAVLFPQLAEEWDFVLNDVLPTEVAPFSSQKYWFRCAIFGILYKQPITSKTNKKSLCPYCSGKSICLQNSLLSTHPELCLEWDFDKNFKYPNEVIAGCNDKVGWICTKREGEIHLFDQPISSRTSIKLTGCEKCKSKGYEQKYGGHEAFVKIASKVHNNKYTYPDPYIDDKTKINMHCPIIGKHSNEVHGLFLQNPSSHKQGAGCKKCFLEQVESKGIVNMKNMLNELGYKEGKDYECEVEFEGMRYKDALSADIVLKFLNEKTGKEVIIVIEWDGTQHFKSVKYWGGEEGLKKTQERDYIKDLYCMNNGISLLRFPDTKKYPTKEELRSLIWLCNHQQVYKSYPHLQNRVRSEANMKGKFTIITEF